ncbi:hypothetical protein GQ602_000944 [Ophiocordyceps camponoti-floridani]|uniref:Uncharacterized protein n=1 Tax=Ophiocordyceps camponoti-floridani TaxID=2030778 RepID=A0A8H4QD48_9HYPO|nr:hypothetical protein GQ602_000944 [Ophiocordyceps camponoti-floridani]
MPRCFCRDLASALPTQQPTAANTLSLMTGRQSTAQVIKAFRNSAPTLRKGALTWKVNPDGQREDKEKAKVNLSTETTGRG